MLDSSGRLWDSKLVKEWDLKRNMDMSNYMLGSHKKVWSICSIKEKTCLDRKKHTW